MYTAVYLMCNMFRIYLIKHLTDMFFQGENPDKKHVVGVCIVFYAVNSALFICLNISLINLICNVLGIGALVCVYSRNSCLLCTSPSPRDAHESRMPSSA